MLFLIHFGRALLWNEWLERNGWATAMHNDQGLKIGVLLVERRSWGEKCPGRTG